jgi:hypothetical protein
MGLESKAPKEWFDCRASNRRQLGNGQLSSVKFYNINCISDTKCDGAHCAGGKHWGRVRCARHSNAIESWRYLAYLLVGHLGVLVVTEYVDG